MDFSALLLSDYPHASYLVSFLEEVSVRFIIIHKIYLKTKIKIDTLPYEV